MATSVFNGGSGSSFGAPGGGGRSFGQFRLVNDPSKTNFGQYLEQVKTNPVEAPKFGLYGYDEGDAQKQYALNTYYQMLADQGASPALIRSMRNKQNDLLTAYDLRNREDKNIRLANFLAQMDAQGSWQGWSPYESGRQTVMPRVRFAS